MTILCKRMPSRKREKGRQRKAKAKANAEGDLSWEEYVQRRKRVDRHGKCLHTILAERLADPSKVVLVKKRSFHRVNSCSPFTRQIRQTSSEISANPDY